jgi:hypothetical protein
MINISSRLTDESTPTLLDSDTIAPVNPNHDARPSDAAPHNAPRNDPLDWALNDEEKQVWESLLDFRKHHPVAFASLKTCGEDEADAVRQALMEENRE